MAPSHITTRMTLHFEDRESLLKLYLPLASWEGGHTQVNLIKVFYPQQVIPELSMTLSLSTSSSPELSSATMMSILKAWVLFPSPSENFVQLPPL